ncbi:hypothetical protein Hanom_Chr08g00695041 [Helianthus anomalus]
MSFQIGKTIFRQKKPHFPSPPPVKWISGTPFSLPSPPLPLLSRSLEHKWLRGAAHGSGGKEGFGPQAQKGT